jgi:hypothetical protein
MPTGRSREGKPAEILGVGQGQAHQTDKLFMKKKCILILDCNLFFLRYHFYVKLMQSKVGASIN